MPFYKEEIYHIFIDFIPILSIFDQKTANFYRFLTPFFGISPNFGHLEFIGPIFIIKTTFSQYFT